MIRHLSDGRVRSCIRAASLLRSDPTVSPEAETPLRIEDEEVPREGALVERAFQYARWLGGTSFVWVGRRKIVGRGEASSGLRYDRLEKNNPA